MKMDYFTFRSITPAQRAYRVLQRGGVEAMLMRTPRWMETHGCGYCLRLPGGSRERAIQVMRQEGVAFGKLYVGEQGNFEEVVL